MATNHKPAVNVYLRFGKDAMQHETEKARLFVVDNAQIWIPKSQTTYFAVEGDTIAITLPDWLVKKNELEEHLDPQWIAAGCPD